MDFSAGVVLCFALTSAVDADRVYIRFVSGAADDNYFVSLHWLSPFKFLVRTVGIEPTFRLRVTGNPFFSIAHPHNRHPPPC